MNLSSLSEHSHWPTEAEYRSRSRALSATAGYFEDQEVERRLARDPARRDCRKVHRFDPLAGRCRRCGMARPEAEDEAWRRGFASCPAPKFVVTDFIAKGQSYAADLAYRFGVEYREDGDFVIFGVFPLRGMGPLTYPVWRARAERDIYAGEWLELPVVVGREGLVLVDSEGRTTAGEATR